MQFSISAFLLAGLWVFASFGPGLQVLVLCKGLSISIYLYHHKGGGRMTLRSSESEGEVVVFSTKCWNCKSS